MGVFRGNRKDFLKYIGISANKKNIKLLDPVLEDLRERNYIGFDDDDDYIIVYVRRKIEKELQIGTSLIKHCKDIIHKYGKNEGKLFQFIKVWIALEICIENAPFTDRDIVNLTGLTITQVRDVRKVLMEDNAFKLTRAGSYFENKGWDGD